MITIKPFDRANAALIKEAAALLETCFPHCYLGKGEEEISSYLENGVSLAAMDEQGLAGFVRAQPQYGITGWEIHPLMVDPRCRKQGVGSALLQELEKAVAEQGGVMLYLGTDDEFGQTSLADTDLYEDLFGKIRAIQNKAEHPYSFYQKNGYQIVGVLPDANGIGKPDIWMAKRIVS